MSIKVLFIDVDGTLTDGTIYMGAKGEIMKAFSVKDGHGLRHIHDQYGVIPVILTGRKSMIVKHRCKELGISNIHQRVKDKVSVIKDYENLFTNCIFAYIGDDVNDLSAMEYIKQRSGIVACPSDADANVISIAHYTCKRPGGDGAVREFIDFLIANNLV